jgi:hypothetical protein
MTVRIQDTIKMKHYLMNRSSLKKAIKKQIPIKEPAFVKKILVGLLPVISSPQLQPCQYFH